jgi:hypothetical protein
VKVKLTGLLRVCTVPEAECAVPAVHWAHCCAWAQVVWTIRPSRTATPSSQRILVGEWVGVRLCVCLGLCVGVGRARGEACHAMEGRPSVIPIEQALVRRGERQRHRLLCLLQAWWACPEESRQHP